MTLLWIALALLALCLVYLWMLAPAGQHPDDSHLRGWLYAHRGLHDAVAPENSMEAFRRAVESGYGIELDVQRTRDDQLVVHHDGNLKRVCGVDKLIRDLTYEELTRVPLPDGSRVPLFSEVLALVSGRVPLIVEVKHNGGAVGNAEMTLALLRQYKGPYCVESFHPLVVRYFRKHAPEIVRGQLADGRPYHPGESSLATWFVLRSLVVNFLGRPHFIAYSVPEDHTLAMWLMKRLFKPQLAAWTIRDEATLSQARGIYHYPIFEGFQPKAK